MSVSNDSFYCPVAIKDALNLYSNLLGTSRSEIIEYSLIVTLNKIESGELALKEIKTFPKTTKQIVSVTLRLEIKNKLIQIHKKYRIRKNDIYIFATNNFITNTSKLLTKIEKTKIAENESSAIFDKSLFIETIGDKIYNEFKEHIAEFPENRFGKKTLVLINKNIIKKIFKKVFLFEA